MKYDKKRVMMLENIIDIHCHALYGVDDGSATQEESIEMFRQAVSRGISAIILTPHYRRGMFEAPAELIQAHYTELKTAAEKMGLSLYLGGEYYADSEITEHIQSGRFHTLAGTEHILTEFSTSADYPFIRSFVQMLMRQGYHPIIAHAERYQCLVKKLDYVDELSRLGAGIQVNADSILGHEGFSSRRFTHKLLKYGLIDFIGSDSHGINHRPSRLAECAAWVERKAGSEYAAQIFCDNPSNILGI